MGITMKTKLTTVTSVLGAELRDNQDGASSNIRLVIMKIQSFLRTAAVSLVLLSSAQGSVQAQGTAITYEGRLQDSINPANGLYDFQFSVFNAPSGGTTQAGPLSTNGVPVTNGLFAIVLDFGAGVFTGGDQWLEIGVRTNGAGSYTTLAPRQQVTPAPYAITAESVETGGLPAGTYGNTFNFNNPSNTFCGDGSCLRNVNATTFGSLTAQDFWQLTGNIVSGSQFLGTLNNLPLEVKVNNTHALRIVPAAVPSLEGGYVGNSAHGFNAAAITGGGTSGSVNEVLGDYGFVGAGLGAKAGPLSAVVGGGNNVALGQYAFVGAGSLNTNLANNSFIGGGANNHVPVGAINGFVGAGLNNTVSSGNTVVAGGANNTADVNAAAISGGSENHAGGDHSFIGGGQGNVVSNAYGTVVGGSGNMLSANWATIGGGQTSVIQPAANYSFIGGGANNVVQFNSAYSTVGGGSGNLIQTNSPYSIVAGGKNNAVNASLFEFGLTPYAVIAGGEGNRISSEFELEGPPGAGDHSVIGGGYSNIVAGGQSVISGGGSNSIAANWGAIPGGQNNQVLGYWSLAAGQRAIANGNGTFVWADSQPADFQSTANDQFCIRAQGGIQLSTNTSLFCGTQTRQMLNLWGTQYGIGVQNLTTYFRCDNSGSILNGFSWFKGGVHNDAVNNPGGGVELMRLTQLGLTVNGTFVSASDRNAKEHFAPVDSREVLEKVVALPVSEWNYKADPTSRHLGPMAQDFYAAFGVGPDDKHITTVDEGGVALAAIQGLNQKIQDRETEIRKLQETNESLEKRLSELESAVRQTILRK